MDKLACVCITEKTETNLRADRGKCDIGNNILEAGHANSLNARILSPPDTPRCLLIKILSQHALAEEVMLTAESCIKKAE